MTARKLKTRCCIAGGGPAGIMLGFLLARAGIDTVVLEKWPDFFRDFRGDTIHPSTMEVLAQLGLLQDFLALPHDKTVRMEAEVGGQKVLMADFSRLPVQCPYIAFIPQWDFLNFMADKAKAYPSFHLLMHTEALDLLHDGDRVSGILASDEQGRFEIDAELVIAADGRHSTLRAKSKLPLQELGAPIDVLWFRISRQGDDPKQSMGKIDRGKMLVMLERGDYWQCGFLVRKNHANLLQEAGLPAFRATVAEILPLKMRDRVNELASWDQVKLLQVSVNRLNKWYQSGLLCIGDAAHAMSPIGGVGINLAIQDAVAAANYLIPAFAHGKPNDDILFAIQKRREWPTRCTQWLQIMIQNKVIDSVLDNDQTPQLPFALKCLRKFPFLSRLTARLIGIGFRPESIRS